MSIVVMEIEVAMFRDGATRLTTRKTGSVHTKHRNEVPQFEEERRFYTHVPHEPVALRFSRFKKYHVYSYGTEDGPRLIARYLNCIKLHMRGVTLIDDSIEGQRQVAVMDMWSCYARLVIGVLKTVQKDKDSFVITGETVTEIIWPHKFEFLGDVGELPEDQQLGWVVLKETVVMDFVRLRKMTSEQAGKNYPELVNNVYVLERL